MFAVRMNGVVSPRISVCTLSEIYHSLSGCERQGDSAVLVCLLLSSHLGLVHKHTLFATNSGYSALHGAELVHGAADRSALCHVWCRRKWLFFHSAHGDRMALGGQRGQVGHQVSVSIAWCVHELAFGMGRHTVLSMILPGELNVIRTF